METRVPGGYAVVSLEQLSTLCALKKADRISFASFRIYLAAVEQRAKRCLAKGEVRFTLQELSRLSGGVGERTVRESLRELEGEGMLHWSEKEIRFLTPAHPEGLELTAKLGTSGRRPVPIPRRLLRLLAKHTKPAEVIAAIAHLVRCLFKRGKAIHMQGFVRAEWVAEVFGVSVRAVYAARAWLVGLGVLKQLPVHQFVMNKHGGLFQVVVETLGGERKPPRKSAGLLKSSTRSYTYKNQINKKDKPALRKEAGFLSRVPKNPTLSAIVPEDLKRLSRLEVLYRQAIRAQWISRSEQDARNFIAAAVRATRIDGDAVRVFVAIVRKKLWHHVSQEQENRAIEAFARHERKTGRRFGEEIRESGGKNRIGELLGSLLGAAASRPEVAGEGRLPEEASAPVGLSCAESGLMVGANS